MSPYWYRVSMFCEEQEIRQVFVRWPLARTLAWSVRQVRGLSCVEVCVRRIRNDALEDCLTAFVHTDWRGEIDEIDIYSPVSSLVTPMNPAYRGFQPV